MSATAAFQNSLERIRDAKWAPEDLIIALCEDAPGCAERLFAAADQVRRARVGEGVHLRGLIEFSNYCTRTCQYCGLRSANRKLRRYRMTPAEIVATALHASELGYRTVVLQSGEDAWYDADIITWIVKRIRTQADLAITLCVGERSRKEYAAWKDAGADRYLLRIETSDPQLYAALHPGMSYQNRVGLLRDLGDLGYQVGSGVLLGLPGQTPEILAGDLQFLARLQPGMVGIGPFIPHPQTPLGDSPRGSVELTLRMMALARLLLPDAYVVATTALGTLDPLGRERGLAAGANVVMPNVTPAQYRAMYEIYPDKICIEESAEKCRGCIEMRVTSVGRHISSDRGDAPRALRSIV